METRAAYSAVPTKSIGAKDIRDAIGPDLNAWERALRELGGEVGADALTSREICVLVLGRAENEGGIRVARSKIKEWQTKRIIEPTRKSGVSIAGVEMTVPAYRLVRHDGEA